MMFLRRRKATFISTLVVRGTMSVATSESADILRIPVSPSEQSSCKLSGIIVLKYVWHHPAQPIGSANADSVSACR
jgi:hypothetical protein